MRAVAVRALRDRVIVKRIGAAGAPAPGTESNRGEVVAVGPGRVLDNGETVPMEVKVGDIIIFNDGPGVKTENVDGQELVLMAEADVYSTLSSSN